MKNETHSWSFELDRVNNWAYWDKLFSEDECDEIIKICKARKLTLGKINSTREVDEEYRKSHVTFVGPSDLEWVYRRLTDACVDLNSKYFGFDLWGLAEGLQFTEYKPPNGKYDDHIDKMFNGKVRKLTLVVQLSKPDKYKGCNLELITSRDKPDIMSRERGHLAVFPSYIMHRVTAIEKGTRHSLVGWITGKPFK